MQKQQLERNIMAHTNNTQIKNADTFFPLIFMQKQQLERNIMAHKNNTQIKGADTFFR